jgi:Tfp pilus assembly protein PilW
MKSLSHLISKYHRRASSPLNPNQGVTLTELIVSTVVASIVITVTLGGSMFNRELYAQDEVRTRVNQTLRSSMDLVGADIQQMGEQIRRDDPYFPVVELTRTPSNPNANDNTWTSTLIMRRNLLPYLPVCQDLGNSTTSTSANGITSIQVFTRAPADPNAVRPPGDCATLINELDTSSAPAVDTTIARWETARQNNGGTLRAFLYDGQGGGQFVTVTALPATVNDSANPAATRAITIQSTNGVQFYANGSAKLYFLEERRYEVANNNLQLTIDNGNPQTIVSGIQRFQVRIDTDPLVATDPLVNHFAFCERPNAAERCFDPTAAVDAQFDAWSVINRLRVTLVAANPNGAGSQVRSKSEEASRILSEDFFPRNAMNFD